MVQIVARIHRRLTQRVLRDARKIQRAGLEIVDWETSRRDTDEVLRTVAEAVSKLESAHPVIYSRVRRSVERIVVEDFRGHSGYYSRDRAAAVVSRELVLRGGVVPTALVIVHEATHAYLEKRGFSYVEDQRARVERICTKREIALAKRIHGGERWIPRLELALRADGRTDAQLIRVRGERLLERLEREGAPRWAVWITRWLYERGLRRRFGDQ